jgi:dTMP kinase
MLNAFFTQIAMEGKIITIEGLDGSGKSTQIDLLTNRLSESGVKHKFIHFPVLNKGMYGKLIAEYLRGELGSLKHVHPKLVALLFAEDRNEHKAQLNEWLNDGYLIIMDRYVNSNIAFQCAKTEDQLDKIELKKWILDFEFNHNALPAPDVSFFLNVPFSHIEKSLNSSRTGADRAYLNGKTDIHEDSLELQRNVYNEYLTLLEEQSNFYEIGCFGKAANWLSPSEIHEAIFNRIQLFNQSISGDEKVLLK